MGKVIVSTIYSSEWIHFSLHSGQSRPSHLVTKKSPTLPGQSSSSKHTDEHGKGPRTDETQVTRDGFCRILAVTSWVTSSCHPLWLAIPVAIEFRMLASTVFSLRFHGKSCFTYSQTLNTSNKKKMEAEILKGLREHQKVGRGKRT